MLGLLNIKQVMEKYGKSENQVRYAIERGSLKGYKLGWVWVFEEDKLPDEWPIDSKLGRKPKS